MVGLFPEIEIVLVLTDSFQRSPILQCIMGDINSKRDFGIRKHGVLESTVHAFHRYFYNTVLTGKEFMQELRPVSLRFESLECM